MTTKLLFIGHRGTRANTDENTVEAFKKALEFGANWVEFDVRKTKDEKKDLYSLIQSLGNIIIVQNEIISRLVLSG